MEFFFILSDIPICLSYLIHSQANVLVIPQVFFFWNCCMIEHYALLETVNLSQCTLVPSHRIVSSL